MTGRKLGKYKRLLLAEILKVVVNYARVEVKRVSWLLRSFMVLLLQFWRKKLLDFAKIVTLYNYEKTDCGTMVK